MNPSLESVKDALLARGFEARVCETAVEAASFILSDLPENASVGCGGSVTIRQLALTDRLRDAGHAVYWHWECEKEQMESVRRAAMNADAYLSSANALTTDGLMVQIDGTGNRIAALCYGPKTVYIVVGVNKLVDGGYASAVARIKQVVCPQNARRLGIQTACAQTGRNDCANCAASICHVTAAFDRAPGGKRTIVLLVNETLGF